jgi:hypothetical protein
MAKVERQDHQGIADTNAVKREDRRIVSTLKPMRIVVE